MDVSLLFLRFSSLAVFSSHIFFFLPLSLLRSVPLCLPAVAAGLVSELRHGLGRRHHRRSARTSGPQPPVSAAAVAAWWQDRRRLHCHWPSEALDSSCPFWPSKCPAASPQLRLWEEVPGQASAREVGATRPFLGFPSLACPRGFPAGWFLFFSICSSLLVQGQLSDGWRKRRKGRREACRVLTSVSWDPRPTGFPPPQPPGEAGGGGGVEAGWTHRYHHTTGVTLHRSAGKSFLLSPRC